MDYFNFYLIQQRLKNVLSKTFKNILIKCQNLILLILILWELIKKQTNQLHLVVLLYVTLFTEKWGKYKILSLVNQCEEKVMEKQLYNFQYNKDGETAVYQCHQIVHKKTQNFIINWASSLREICMRSINDTIIQKVVYLFFQSKIDYLNWIFFFALFSCLLIRIFTEFIKSHNVFIYWTKIINLQNIHQFMFEEYNKKHSQIHFRYLKRDDYDHGLFQLLKQLADKTVKPTREQFQNQLNRMDTSNGVQINIVGINPITKNLIAAGKIKICNTIDGRVGKISSIVTHKDIRGKGYGKLLIKILTQQGWRNNCQSVTLFSFPDTHKFYLNIDFKYESEIMAGYRAKL